MAEDPHGSHSQETRQAIGVTTLSRQGGLAAQAYPRQDTNRQGSGSAALAQPPGDLQPQRRKGEQAEGTGFAGREPQGRQGSPEAVSEDPSVHLGEKTPRPRPEREPADRGVRPLPGSRLPCRARKACSDLPHRCQSSLSRIQPNTRVFSTRLTKSNTTGFIQFAQ